MQSNPPPVRSGAGGKRVVPPRNSVIVWDTETTGFGQDARIVEIAFRQIYTDDEPPKELALLINPGRRIGNSRIHGISNEMVSKQPPFKEAWTKIVDFVHTCALDAGGCKPILVAHNAKFDKGILQGELKRIKMKLPDWHFACSITNVCKIVWPARSTYKQQDMIDMLGIQNYAQHRALGDVRALAELMDKADEHLSRVVRQSSVPILRDDSSFDVVDPASGKYRRGDAVRALILQKLHNVRTPTAEGARSRLSIQIVVQAGGVFCTRNGEVFHSRTSCDGLRKAFRVYEISGPVSDRRPCRLCGSRNRVPRNGPRASDQIEGYLESRRTEKKLSSSASSSAEHAFGSSTGVAVAPASQTTSVKPRGAETVEKKLASGKTSSTLERPGKQQSQCAFPESLPFFYSETGKVYHNSKTCKYARGDTDLKEAATPPNGRRPCKNCPRSSENDAQSRRSKASKPNGSESERSRRTAEVQRTPKMNETAPVKGSQRKTSSAWLAPDLRDLSHAKSKRGNGPV